MQVANGAQGRAKPTKGNLVCNDDSHTKFICQPLQAAEKQPQMLLPARELTSTNIVRPVVTRTQFWFSMPSMCICGILTTTPRASVARRWPISETKAPATCREQLHCRR